MGKKGEAGRPQSRTNGVNYMVVTVTELDLMVYKELRKSSAAKPSSSKPGTYVITDKEKAQSTIVLPKILNPLGKKGWRLCAVNNMECYIFRQEKPIKPLEYRVVTPPELDRMGLQNLEQGGHVKVSGFEGSVPTVEVTSPQHAQIQKVLPDILANFTEEGWELTAINGPQLYFFTRQI